MPGDAAEPQITADDVYQVARSGSRSWRTDNRAGTWRLTRDDLLAIDSSWGGEVDDLSPLTAQAIAASLNAERPWRRPEDPDQPLSWASDIDTSRPHPARMYDYYLGGLHNFEADRRQAELVSAHEPRVREYARINRQFLYRAVRFMATSGMRQFLDLGSGIPAAGNVHEIVAQLAPDSRVVYVDVDPIVVALSRKLLAGNPAATALQADLRSPDTVLGHPDVQRLLDLTEPVALLMVAVLHFVPDADDPGRIVAAYRRALAAGSQLAISHACPPREQTPHGTAARDAYDATNMPVTLRTPAQVAELFSGWKLVLPGLVDVGHWRNEDEDHSEPVPGVAGVAYLPTPEARAGMAMPSTMGEEAEQ